MLNKIRELKLVLKILMLSPGKQLVYQIPNNMVLTTKIGLLCSLREYERVSSKVNHGQGLRWSGQLYSYSLCLLLFLTQVVCVSLLYKVESSFESHLVTSNTQN